ncbi:hypothetical protein MJO28_000881, partial [Puccinia striiformis f. sp. tritici]
MATVSSQGNQRDSKLFQSLGLAQDVKPINVLAYLAYSFVSVSSLVFISASTSFVLTALIHLPADCLGRTNGALILLDELVALPAVLVWGRLADIYARATTMGVTAYIPVFVNQYFTSTGQCQLDRPDAPPQEVKKACHAAFALASALTGTVQVGFILFGLLPRPNHFLVWTTCILLGLSQIMGIIVSLSLCASCRWQIFHSESAISQTRQTESTPLISDPTPPQPDQAPWRDISGAIAGVYSLSGGLAILVGSFGGILSDWSPRAPFFLTGGITCVASLVCNLAGHS